MQRTLRNVSVLAAWLLAGAAWAQQPIFYPAKGQSQQKQSTDMSQCESWATQNTGVNPAVLAQNSANQQSAPPQQTSSAPAPSQSTETTTQTKSVEVQPSPNPADPDASGQKMVKKETTTVKKQQ